MGRFLELQIDYLLILQNFREITHGIFDNLFGFITQFGEYLFLLLIVALIYWMIDKKCGLYMLFTFYFSLMINQFLKVTACIYRPWVLDSRIQPVPSAIKMATGYSFPSGHTAGATSIFGSIAVWLWKNKLARYLSILAILLVGFSRNYLGVHTPQDVVVSLILGAFVLFGNLKLLKWLEKNKNNDIVLFAIILVASLLLVLYTELKTYPVDYLNGQILVDPESMKFESLPKAGFVLGMFLGWIIENRTVNFDTKNFSMPAKIFLYLIGALGIYLICSHLISFLIEIFGKNIGGTSGFFILGSFISLIYPLVLKIYANIRYKSL